MDKSVGVVEAVLLAGGLETPYRRAGHGPPVLLLVDRIDLLEALAPHYRVIQPLRAPDDPQGQDWPGWLRDVVDGLGLGRPAMVVDPGLAGTMQTLADSDPHRVGPIVAAGPPARVVEQLGTASANIDR